MSLRFSNLLAAELYQPFWAAWDGDFVTDAAAVGGPIGIEGWRGCASLALERSGCTESDRASA